jgi:hypothetical protein
MQYCRATNANALPRILSTTAYGSAAAYRIAQQNLTLTRILCKATVFLELLFPVLLILPKELFFAFLVWGVLFHLSLAFLMGLNIFFWPFIATYPQFILFGHYCIRLSCVD